MEYGDFLKTPFAQKLEEFEAAQEKYVEFGAGDTEPRTEFCLYIQSIVKAATRGGEESPLPKTISDWQLFDREVLGRTGSGEAARALTKAARAAGKEARKDIASARWYLNRY